MGNRAVITTRKEWERGGIGVYLHWNGGRDSVEGFLKYCEMKGYREPDKDCYGWARLCQVIGNFFGGSNSVGIDRLWYLDKDNGDNGVYILEGWEIVDRYYLNGAEQQEYDLNEMLKAINKDQPEKEKLPEDLFDAIVTPTEDLIIGNEVYVQDWSGDWSLERIVGRGEKRVVNGTDVEGVPYTEQYPGGPDNINNYLGEPTYRLSVKKVLQDMV